MDVCAFRDASGSWRISTYMILMFIFKNCGTGFRLAF